MLSNSIDNAQPSNNNNNDAEHTSQNKKISEQLQLEKWITTLFISANTENQQTKKIDANTLQAIIDLLRDTPTAKLDLNASVNEIPLLTYLFQLAFITKKISANESNEIFRSFGEEFVKLLQKDILIACDWHKPANALDKDYYILLGLMPVHSLVHALACRQSWAIQLYNNIISAPELKINWSIESRDLAPPFAIALNFAFQRANSSILINPPVAFFVNEYLRNSANKINLNATIGGISYLNYFIEIVKVHRSAEHAQASNSFVDKACSSITALLNHQSVSEACHWDQRPKNPSTLAKPHIYDNSPLHMLVTALDQEWAVFLLGRLVDEGISSVNWLLLNAKGKNSLGHLIHYFNKKISSIPISENPYNSSELTFFQEITNVFLSDLPNTELDNTVNLNNKIDGIPLLTYLLAFCNLLDRSHQFCADPVIMRLQTILVNSLVKNSSFSHYDWNQKQNRKHHYLLNTDETPLFSLLNSMKFGKIWAFQLFQVIASTPNIKLNWSKPSPITPLWLLVSIVYKGRSNPSCYKIDDLAMVTNYLQTLIKTLSSNPSANNFIDPTVDIWNKDIPSTNELSIFAMISALTKANNSYSRLLLDLMCNPDISLRYFPLTDKTVKGSFINTLLESSDPVMQSMGFAFIILQPERAYSRIISSSVKWKVDEMVTKVTLAANKYFSFSWTQENAPITMDEALKTNIIVDGITEFFDELPFLKAMPQDLLKKIVKKAILSGSFIVAPNVHRPYHDSVTQSYEDYLSSHSFKVATITARDAYLNAQSPEKLLAYFKKFISGEQNEDINPQSSKKKRSFNPFQACCTTFLDTLYEVLTELREENVLPNFLDFARREVIRRTVAKLPSLEKDQKTEIKRAIKKEMIIHDAFTVLRHDKTLSVTHLTDEKRRIVSEEISKISEHHNKNELKEAITTRILALSATSTSDKATVSNDNHTSAIDRNSPVSTVPTSDDAILNKQFSHPQTTTMPTSPANSTDFPVPNDIKSLTFSAINTTQSSSAASEKPLCQISTRPKVCVTYVTSTAPNTNSNIKPSENNNNSSAPSNIPLKKKRK